MYTIWAVFGGFILHFLLSNYLTVLLLPTHAHVVDVPDDDAPGDVLDDHEDVDGQECH